MGIIILGAFVAGARDLSFDVYAYAVVFMANICTAIYLALIARIGNVLNSYIFLCLRYCAVKNSFLLVQCILDLSGKSSGLNTFGLMWCNGKIRVLTNFHDL